MSPLDAAERASSAEPELPQDLALVVRVQAPQNARLLSGEEDLLPAGDIAQDDRCAEIVVRSIVLWAIGRSRATVDEVVVSFRLAAPLKLSGVERVGDDGIARVDVHARVGVAGGDVDQFAFDIDGGCGPH